MCCTAPDNYNSSRSNRSPQDGDGIFNAGTSVKLTLASTGKFGDSKTNFTSSQNVSAQGTASFANVMPGDYSLTIKPAQTASGMITGAQLSQNALIHCNSGLEADGSRVCPDVTVKGTGPQTVTVQLLGKSTTMKSRPTGKPGGS